MKSIETPNQRTLPAASIEKPQGARSSVFDVARQRKKRTLLDVGAVVIHSGKPIPPNNTGTASPYAELLDKMKPGQSVELPASQASSLVKHAGKKKITVVQRKLGNGITGVWRVR